MLFWMWNRILAVPNLSRLYMSLFLTWNSSVSLMGNFFQEATSSSSSLSSIMRVTMMPQLTESLK